jgi:hypothetical protein
MPRNPLDEKRMVCKVSIFGHREDQWSVIHRGKAIPCPTWEIAALFAAVMPDAELNLLYSTANWMHPRELFPLEVTNA